MDSEISDRFSTQGLDSLTGLHDRSFLSTIDGEYLNKENPLSLLMIDVDHFKLINDIYGHLTGDKVLKQTALTIQINLKETDTAVRFGGDEFIVILPDTDQEGALDLAQRLIYEINRVSFSSGLHISISIGVTRRRPEDNSLMDLVSRADKALYKAKEGGRGRMFFFTSDLPVTNAPQISLSHLVGRRPELQKLRQLLEESVTDSSRFAIVSGEAGIGKTRLVEELLNYCDFMKSSVVRKTLREHSQFQPFSILIEPVSEELAGLNEDEFRRVCSLIEPVHPATLDLFPELQVSVMDDTVYFREERLKFRIFKDISAMLEAISSIHPITLILDNLQWITEPDLALLTFVARNASDSNILFLAIMRKDETLEKLFRKLFSIRSSLPLLNLEINKMTTEETRNMILFALKDPNVPMLVQEFLIHQSGGNPLFLRELLTACVDSGYISTDQSGENVYNLPDDIEVPESIGQIITMKLSRITGEATELLQIVSLSPDLFTISLLEGMTGRESLELARKLDECIKAGIIEEVEAEDGNISFRFAHGAVRDYLSSDLPQSLRDTLHLKLAAYFRQFLENGRQDLLSAVAYHFSKSQDNVNAADFALRAAQQAFNRGANRDAIHWYKTHLDRIPNDLKHSSLFLVHINLGSLYSLTGEVEKADHFLDTALELASDQRELAAVYFRLGSNNMNRSLYPQTLENYNKVIELSLEDDPGDPIVLRILIQTLIETSFVHRLQGDYDKAISSLDRAEELLTKNHTAEDTDIYALYCTRRADVILELDSEDEAIELYNRALAVYERTNDLPGLSTVLNNMHEIYSHQGDYNRCLSVLEEVIRINMNLDDKMGLAIGYYNIAGYYQEINMLDLARQYYEKYMELNNAIKNELGIGYGRFGLGKLHWLEDELEKSKYYFESAREVFERLECTQMKTECDLMIAMICLQTDNFKKAGEILELFTDDIQNSTVTLNTMYMKGLFLLSHPDSDIEALENAVLNFRAVVESSVEPSEVDTSQFYSALASALDKLDRDDEKIAAIKEGSRKLAVKLQHIRSYSVRNSIMTRREIVEFIDLCRSSGLPFPPDGFTFESN